MSSSGQYQTLVCSNGSTSKGNMYNSTNFGQTWTQIGTYTNLYWTSVSISSSGQYQVATTQYYGIDPIASNIYISSSYGANSTWSIVTTGVTNPSWSGVAMNASGQYLTVVNNGGFVYQSTNTAISNTYFDQQYLTAFANIGTTFTTFGQTWVQNTTVVNTTYLSNSMSSSGQYQLISSTNGFTYVSTNYGVTFSTATSSYNGYNAMNSTGQYMTICTNPAIGYSNNFGASWQTSTYAGSTRGNAVAISSSGQYQCVGTQTNGGIYVSTDFGVTFTQGPGTTGLGFPIGGVAISASGQYQVGVVSSATGGIWLSTNYGASWAVAAYSGTTFACVAMSTSGQYITAYNNGTNVYVSINFGQTFTQISTSITSGTSLGSTMTASGLYQVIINTTGVFISTNYGRSWSRPSGAPTSSLASVASNSSGQYLTITTNSGSGYIYQCTNTTGSGGGGSSVPTGTFYGDYQFWNSYSSQWVVGSASVNIGQNAGYTGMGTNCVAIGYQAGKGYNSSQGLGNYSTAIGNKAGSDGFYYNSGQNSITISAGQYGALAGTNSITLSTANSQSPGSPPASCIIMNASTNNITLNSFSINNIILSTGGGVSNSSSYSRVTGFFNQANSYTIQNSGFFVSDVRSQSYGSGALQWNSSTFEITYNSSKTFVIDHPVDKDKYLVHACLEGPESGVYYRGKGEVVNDNYTTIVLPDYVDALATNFTVHVTPILDRLNRAPRVYQASEVENGSFIVDGPPGKFFWVVYGERASINVEPLKSSVKVNGDGPYTWIS